MMPVERMRKFPAEASAVVNAPGPPSGVSPRASTFGRREPVHRYAWLWEPLETDPTFVLRAMFGTKAACLDGKLMFCFAAKTEPWRGLLVCTDLVRQPSLLVEFPALASASDSPQMALPRETADAFEPLATRLVALARRRDTRLGVLPSARSVAAPRNPSSDFSGRPNALPPNPASLKRPHALHQPRSPPYCPADRLGPRACSRRARAADRRRSSHPPRRLRRRPQPLRRRRAKRDISRHPYPGRTRDPARVGEDLPHPRPPPGVAADDFTAKFSGPRRAQRRSFSPASTASRSSSRFT